MLALSKAGEGLVVYADVLMVTNLFINYFLLSAVKLLLRVSVPRKRILFGALIGSVYALTIFLPKLPTAVSALMNLSASALMVFAAFPIHSRKKFLKAFLAFFVINFAFAGTMLALWLFFRPNGMIYQNGTVYFDIDIKILIGTTVLCYILLTSCQSVGTAGTAIVFGFGHFALCHKRLAVDSVYQREWRRGSESVLRTTYLCAAKGLRIKSYTAGAK